MNDQLARNLRLKEDPAVNWSLVNEINKFHDQLLWLEMVEELVDFNGEQPQIIVSIASIVKCPPL